MSGRPTSERPPTRAFRALARLMPRGFREVWLTEAVHDLEETLRAVRERDGPLAARVTGARATLDLARRLPTEWIAALRGRGRSARGAGQGTGDVIMTWLAEMRQSARALARRPGFSGAAILTLGVGIGANVAIFSVVDTVVLSPLPYPEADRIVSVRHHAPALNLPELESSQGMQNFYAAEADFFAALGAFGSPSRNLVGGPRPERVQLGAVTPEVFDVLRTPPAIGRPFNEADVEEGAAPVLILMDAAWRTRFGADPGVLGRTVELDGRVAEIVGVMPRGFAFPSPDAVALEPMRIDPEGPFGTFGTNAIARIADGLTLEQAQRRAAELQARVPEFFPDLTAEFLDQAGWSVTLQRFQDRVVGEDIVSALWIVLGTVGVVLLIACANVANLFLVRAESRQKELAVRAAMGAGRRRIASGFLSEALLLGLGGGVLGVALAWGGVELLAANGPTALPRLHELGLDGTSLAFAGIVSVMAALVLGAFPLLRYGGGRLAQVLRDGGRGSTDGRTRHRTRNILVAGQLALALVLLVGSGLMLRSFQALRTIDPGFDGDDVVAVGLALVEGADNVAAARFHQQVADEVAALPGVTSVGLTTKAPLAQGNANGGSFYVEGIERGENDLPPVAMYKVIAADYLETMGHELLEGRALETADWQEGAEPVVLVNASFRDRYLDGEAVGKAIRWDDRGTFARIVGVVADAREMNIRDESGPWGYLPMRVADWGYPHLDRMSVMVKTARGVASPVSAIRDIVSRLDPSVPITSVRSMDEIVGGAIAGTSFTMVLLGIAAGMALFLGAIGLFGVISYVVSQRTREIGVRVALGARGEDIRGLVFQQGATVAVVGVMLGLAGAASLTRLMRAVLFEVSPVDPLSFVVASAVLLGVAVSATWLPARRASRVDPMVALRAE